MDELIYLLHLLVTIALLVAGLALIGHRFIDGSAPKKHPDGHQHH